MTIIKTIRHAVVAALAVSAALGIPAEAQSYLTNGLVAYYPLNGNANDASGNGNDGTINGVTFGPDRFGNANGAGEFNGLNTFVQASASSLPSSDRTVTVWFYATNLDGGRYFLGYGGGTCGTSFIMVMNNQDGAGGLNMFETQSHCGMDRLDGPMGTNAIGYWHQFAVTIQGSATALYIDANQIAEGNVFSILTSVAGTDLIIGTGVEPTGSGPVLTDPNASPFMGALNDIRIYNRALSPTEVAQLYAHESAAESQSPAPGISLIQAVIPSFTNLAVGDNYQLQISTNLTGTYTNYGAAFTATNSSEVYPQYFDIAGSSQLFFRLATAP